MKENKQVNPAVSSCTAEIVQKDGLAKISRSPGIAVHNYIIDHMVNDAGGHVREVIETLSDLGFTEEELIEVFHFSETDVKVCLAYADKDKEVE